MITAIFITSDRDLSFYDTNFIVAQHKNSRYIGYHNFHPFLGLYNIIQPSCFKLDYKNYVFLSIRNINKNKQLLIFTKFN